MDYEARMRLKARLQRLGAPALLEEVIRLGEEVDQLRERVARLEGTGGTTADDAEVFADTSPSKSS